MNLPLCRRVLPAFLTFFCFYSPVPAQQIPPSAYLSEQSVRELESLSPGPDPEGYELRDLFLNEVVAHGPADVKAFDERAAEVFNKESALVERLMHNQVSLLGYVPQDVGTPVDWFHAPKGDLQWPTHLSRHYWLKPLAHAWRATKDPAYSRKITDVLLDWIENNPIGRDKLTWWGNGDWNISNDPDSIREGFFPGYADGPWTSLSAHVRLDNWTYLLAMIYDSPQMTNRNLSVIFNSMAGDHRNMMLGHPRQMNQFISIASSLVRFRWYYPFLKGSKEVEAEGLERVRRYADSEIYPDGSMAECSPNYSKGSLNRVYQMVREDQVRGGQLYQALDEKICRALRYFAFSADPQGYPPRIAKGGKGSAYPLIEKILPVCRDEQVRYVYSNGKEGQKPDFLSKAWNWAGHVIFRSDWSPDATWLFFEPGPRGSGHAHPATLNIQLQTKGEWILTDPGYYTYSNVGEDGRMTKYLGSSAAHNVALVDGENQIPFRRGESIAVNKHPGNYHWSDSGGLAKAEGIYRFGYGEHGRIKVIHRREIIYDRPANRFVIRDTFTGDGEHAVDLHWQLPPGAVLKKEGRGFRIKNGQAKARFNIACDQPFHVESAIGSKEPLSGWFSETYGKLEPAYTVKVLTKGVLPIVFTTEIRLK